MLLCTPNAAGANPDSRHIELHGCPLPAGRQQTPPNFLRDGPPRSQMPTQTHSTNATPLRKTALRQFIGLRYSYRDYTGLPNRLHHNDNPIGSKKLSQHISESCKIPQISELRFRTHSVATRTWRKNSFEVVRTRPSGTALTSHLRKPTYWMKDNETTHSVDMGCINLPRWYDETIRSNRSCGTGSASRREWQLGTRLFFVF